MSCGVFSLLFYSLCVYENSILGFHTANSGGCWNTCVCAYVCKLDRHRLPVPLGGVPTRPRGRAGIGRRRGPAGVLMTG